VVSEAEMSLLPEDDMIEHSNPEKVAREHESVGQTEVVFAGCDLAARVVVGEDHTGRSSAKKAAVDVRGGDGTLREPPHRDDDLSEGAIARIDRYRDEALDVGVG